ncbi:hypothetical protein ACFXPI_15505 [Streptomyces sp. NPDC059104]|uniref:hypothetical protein n=1 Tax=Streptomyces sp. NPDC059104 TaxID=3346729 RepID=UPI00368404DA
MIGYRPPDPDDDREADVPGTYPQDLRNRLDGERFEVLVRTVRSTCALPEEGDRTVPEVPGDHGLAPGLRREYPSPVAVVITGHLDHHLTAVVAPDGGEGRAVVENTVDLTGREP